MIRIAKPPTPAVLKKRGQEATRRLRDDYDADPGPLTRGEVDFNSKLYAHETVKAALRTAQHHKCAFCESKVSHVAHGDIEHYRPKKAVAQRVGDLLEYPGYYWLAYEWDNLFFCCQLCNQSFKRNLFPLRNPSRRARSHHDPIAREEPLLIHPAHQEPADFLTYIQEVAHPVGSNPEGFATIEVVGLNRAELRELRAQHLRQVTLIVRSRDHFLATKLTRPLTPDEERHLAELESEVALFVQDSAPYARMTRALLR